MDIDKHRNQKFSTVALLDQIETQLAVAALNINRSDFSLSEHDLLEVKSAEESVRLLIERYFKYILEMSNTRRKNILSHNGTVFISLGEDCLPRTILTQWGIKLPAAFGERSGPFDLSVHPVGTVADLLERKFVDYMKTENLRYDEEKNLCFNVPLRVSFNHEPRKDFASDGFHKLKEMYSRRIAHFYDCVESSNDVVFVLHLREPHRMELWNDVGRIARSIENLRKSQKFSIIVISTWGKRDESAIAQRPQFPPFVNIIDVDKPSVDYTWHQPRQSFSPAGFEFEKYIVAKVGEIVGAR